MITLQKLEQMFSGIRAETKWNVDGDMLWGYFFTDPDPQKLAPVAQHLERVGYRVVSIYETDNKNTQVLHVERVEVHSPQTLHARNLEFDQLAHEFGLASYDGMDVGPVPMR